MHALYPGSFDPVTFGHVDLCQRGLELFGELTIAVATNVGKSAVFTLDERLELLRASLPEDDRLHIVAFDGLVVDYCRAHRHPCVLRGLRNGTDLEYEYQMANTNRVLAGNDGIETVFLVTSPEHSHLSSSLIKEIARLGGDVSAFVPEAVVDRLAQKLRG